MIYAFSKPVKAWWRCPDQETDDWVDREIWLIGWDYEDFDRHIHYISIWNDVIPDDQIKDFL